MVTGEAFIFGKSNGHRNVAIQCRGGNSGSLRCGLHPAVRSVAKFVTHAIFSETLRLRSRAVRFLRRKEGAEDFQSGF
jgi:hypothetical protein